MNVSRLHSLSTFLQLTVGYAVVHFVLAMWAGTIIASVWTNSGLYESIQFQEDGEPLISRNSYDGTFREYRTLDGTAVSAPDAQRRMASSTNVWTLLPGEPQSWQHRLTPFNDGQTPAAFWYLLAPPDAPGTAYFIGYDAASRRLIGYLGIQGFTTHTPSPTDSFHVRTNQHYPFQGIAASPQHQYLYASPYEPHYLDGNAANFANVPVDAAWLLAGDELYEVRLQSRTVKPLLTGRTGLRSLLRSQVKRDGHALLKLLVRTDTGVLSFDPGSQELREWPLDPAPLLASETFLELPDGGLTYMLTHRNDNTDQPAEHTFVWFDAAGEETRRATAQTSNLNTSTSGALMTAGMSISAPVPVVPLGLLTIGPWVSSPTEFPGTTTVGERFQRLLLFVGGWLAVTVAIGIACGWACRRRERDVFHNPSWFWPILVGLCGWFGWLGYICTRPLPARLPHGHWLPSQPDPVTPLGTEIFA
jgi:hypothetical protein